MDQKYCSIHLLKHYKPRQINSINPGHLQKYQPIGAPVTLKHLHLLNLGWK